MTENFKYAVTILSLGYESDKEWLQNLFNDSPIKEKTRFEFDTKEEADNFENKLNEAGHKTFRNRIMHF